MDTNIKAEIILDSLNPFNKSRLTTMLVTMPRCLLAEINTHRMFSRNSASSRAIPFKRLVEKIKLNPYVPSRIEKNQKGMQGGDEIDKEDQFQIKRKIVELSLDAIEKARAIDNYGVHKQIVNRYLEPWLYHTILISATEWDNFFGQRCEAQAEPHMQMVAYAMLEAYLNSEPISRDEHLPFLSEEEWYDDNAVAISIARCARTSYDNFDHKRSKVKEDIELSCKLSNSRHWSPFEHVATAMRSDEFHGNFRGWIQYRKRFSGENMKKLDLSAIFEARPEWCKRTESVPEYSGNS